MKGSSLTKWGGTPNLQIAPVAAVNISLQIVMIVLKPDRS